MTTQVVLGGTIYVDINGLGGQSIATQVVLGGGGGGGGTASCMTDPPRSGQPLNNGHRRWHQPLSPYI